MTVFLRPGHNKWARLCRTNNPGLDILDIEHVRVEVNGYMRKRVVDAATGKSMKVDGRPVYVNGEYLGKVWRHVAVVTLTNGQCFVGVAQYNYLDQFEGKPYKRSQSYNIAVGKALKKAALGQVDFMVDSEYRGRDYGIAVRTELSARNYFDINEFDRIYGVAEVA